MVYVSETTTLEVHCAGHVERDAWADIETYWTKYQAWGYSNAPTDLGAKEPATGPV